MPKLCRAICLGSAVLLSTACAAPTSGDAETDPSKPGGADASVPGKPVDMKPAAKPSPTTEDAATPTPVPGGGDKKDTAAPPQPVDTSSVTPPAAPTDGDLSVDTGEKVVSDCFVLTKVEGSDAQLVGSATLKAGASLLLLQVQDKVDGKSGDQADVGADKLGLAGSYELATVVSSAAAGGNTTATLAAKPKAAFATAADGKKAQACVVRAYGSVTVAKGASLVAAPWDGKTGGVLAFTAQSLTVNGEINTTGRGLRGGPYTLTHYHADDDAGKRKLTSLDTDSGWGGYKGENVDGSSAFPKREGRGNFLNGGGGGNSTHAGGGGGGGAAKGGFGGMQHGFYGAGEPNTRGMPGAGVKSPTTDRLLMGGGGGQGQQVVINIKPEWCQKNGFVTKMEQLTAGGNGGGVVYVSAEKLDGSGRIASDGTRGGCAESDGAGGGGGGGSVWLKATQSTFTGTVSAVGGVGGENLNTNSSVGPGGGGGGGRVRAALPAGGTAKVDVKGGPSGMNWKGNDKNSPKSAYGAEGGQPGVAEMP